MPRNRSSKGNMMCRAEIPALRNSASAFTRHRKLTSAPIAWSLLAAPMQMAKSPADLLPNSEIRMRTQWPLNSLVQQQLSIGPGRDASKNHQPSLALSWTTGHGIIQYRHVAPVGCARPAACYS